MKEHPILFSTMMVQANMEGRKGMTRRLSGLDEINKSPDSHEFFGLKHVDLGPKKKNVYCALFRFPPFIYNIPCPYGQPGDILWVRESWQAETLLVAPEGDHDEIIYRYKASERSDPMAKWRPSIFMPKEVARIWLQVTDVRVEQLQDISEEDAVAEGVKPAHCETNHGCPSLNCKNQCSEIGNWWNYRAPDGEGFPAFSARSSFESLWESINGADSWQANPWVWVISYKILSKTGKPDLSTLKAMV